MLLTTLLLGALLPALVGAASTGFHRVSNLPGSANIDSKQISYAGYYPIVTRGSHTAGMFGWFFPSLSDPMQDPIILYTTECSSQLAIFWENGPWYINENFMLQENSNSWTKNASILYVDSLFGLGFSEVATPQDEDYIHSDKEMAEFMYKFLQQFYQQFSSYRQQTVYIHAEGKAAHWGPQLADYILQMNSGNLAGQTYVRLAGILLASSWIEPSVQYNSVPYATTSGLLTEGSATATKLEQQAAACYEALSLEEWGDVASLCDTLVPLIKVYAPWIEGYPINEYNIKKPCYPADSYKQYQSYDLEVADPKMECYKDFIVTDYLNQPSLQAALGVSTLTTWVACPSQPHVPMHLAYMKNAASALGVLLNKKLAVTFYNGKNSLVSDWKSAQSMLSSIYWSGQYYWNKASFKNYKNGRNAEYKSYGGLTHVTVEDAGHYVAHDQPFTMSSIFSTALHGFDDTEAL